MSVTLLRQELMQQEGDAAAVKQELLRADEDRNLLRGKLERTNTALTELSQREHNATTALNKRDALIAAAQKQIVALETELSVRAKKISPL